MSITDELRKWGYGFCGSSYEVVNAIADRIDAEHEAMLADVRKMVYQGLIELPKDADGEYINIGDAVTCGATVWTVTGLKFLGEGWGICCTVYNEYGGSGTSLYPPSDLRHHHAPTVEDVLREFALACEGAGNAGPEVARIATEYAKRLTLAEGEDA